MPGLNKDIRHHIWYRTLLTHKITRSDIKSNMKWAISLVITDSHFDLPKGQTLSHIWSGPSAWCGRVWVDILTISPPRLWYKLQALFLSPSHVFPYTPKQWAKLPLSTCSVTPLPPWIYFLSENSIWCSAKPKCMCPELWLAEKSFQTSNGLIQEHFLQEHFLWCTGLGEKQYERHMYVFEMSSHINFWWTIDKRRQ